MPNFASFFSPANLSAAVKALLNGHFDVISDCPRVSTGADKLELPLFLRDEQMHLATIERQIIRGAYTFRPFLEREIPKPDSTDLRTISIATIRDSIVQRALYDYLYPVVDARLSESVFGYRKGISAHDAVRLIRNHFCDGRVFVFDADLEKFFDTVKHDVLFKMVSQLPIDARAVTLIRRFLKTGRIPSCQVEEQRNHKGKQIKYVPIARTIGVPQGGILSGLLSNLYLSQFDAAIRQHQIGLVRYADDFLVCCKSERECELVHQCVSRELGPLEVKLHPKKTRECVPAASGVDFVGFRISTRGIRVRSRNIAKFKARIQGVFQKQQVLKTASRTLRVLVRRLSFKIRGPNEMQLKKLAARGKPVGLCRRSWIGYFRITDDLAQIRSIDRWLRKEISSFMWEKHRVRCKWRHMQRAGLPTLVKCLWIARSSKIISGA